jgi:pimeloyl-ACP methyl ester carboxylesterase
MGAYSLPMLAWMFVVPPDPATRFEQLAPAPAVAFDGDAPPGRRPDQTRAVILIHGLRIHPFNAVAVGRAEPSRWQTTGAPVVRALAPVADVYAFHYAQTMPLDAVARLPALARAVRSLREAGYSEVILVGFSAGGVIARQFVEDTPGSGATRVIQVCSPNTGSNWSVLQYGVRANQQPFIRSVARGERERAGRDRGDRLIPADVEMVCVVGIGAWLGDGVVSRSAQWPADLRSQGIPAVTATIPHVGAMYSGRVIERVAELATTPQPRWTPEQVAERKKSILGPLAGRTTPAPKESPEVSRGRY